MSSRRCARMSVCVAVFLEFLIRSMRRVKMTYEHKSDGPAESCNTPTVLPLPVAREMPRRLCPRSIYEITDWMHSSWYCLSFMAAPGASLEACSRTVARHRRWWRAETLAAAVVVRRASHRKDESMLFHGAIGQLTAKELEVTREVREERRVTRTFK